MKPKEYAVYKGDELICTGTAQGCAEYMGIKLKSFQFLKTPTYKKRCAERPYAENYITVERLEDDE